MKKLILLAIITGLFSLNVHADWDPVLEARVAAERLCFAISLSAVPGQVTRDPTWQNFRATSVYVVW